MCTSTISIVGMYSLLMVYGGSKKRKERRRGVHTRLVILIRIKTMTKEKEGQEGYIEEKGLERSMSNEG